MMHSNFFKSWKLELGIIEVEVGAADFLSQKFTFRGCSG